MTPTLTETWAGKMAPEEFDRRGLERRRPHSERGAVSAAALVMLTFVLLLWAYLGAHVVWWAVR